MRYENEEDRKRQHHACKLFAEHYNLKFREIPPEEDKNGIDAIFYEQDGKTIFCVAEHKGAPKRRMAEDYKGFGAIFFMDVTKFKNGIRTADSLNVPLYLLGTFSDGVCYHFYTKHSVHREDVSRRMDRGDENDIDPVWHIYTNKFMKLPNKSGGYKRAS